MTSNFLYRFRKSDALLEKYNELEKQEICFSTPESLNDPIEGFKDIFWSGDQIVWRKFLEHYILCLELVCRAFVLGENLEKLTTEQNFAFLSSKNLPTNEDKSIYQEICNLFFQDERINKYAEWLSSRYRPIKDNELHAHLRGLHYHAIGSIFSVYEAYRLIPQSSYQNIFCAGAKKQIVSFEAFDALNKKEKENPENQDIADIFYATQRYELAQVGLINQYNNPLFSSAINKKILLIDFPEIYIKKLEKLIHPDWYTACFLSNCENASMWGHYGDNHRGICLKYKTIPNASGERSIKLNGITGIGGSSKITKPIFGEREHKFYKINYSQKYPEVNFFRSLGQLPMPSLERDWYMDEYKNRSICAEDIFENEGAWRKKHWDNFIKSITTKLEDWKYEEEHRLILYSLGSIDYTDMENRKLKYRFSDLEGIIFGIKTPDKIKLEIMKIIDEKCKKENRGDFKFYQARYSRVDNKIESVEMNRIKFVNL